MMSYQKDHRSAPSAPAFDDHISIVKSEMNRQQVYPPAGPYVPRPPTTAPHYAQPEPQFHILPHPYPNNNLPHNLPHNLPYPGPANMPPPPSYTPNYTPQNPHSNMVPAINPHSIPGVPNKITYLPGPARPYPANQGGYVPQSTSACVDRNAFDCGARFDQGARPVLPPCPPGCVPHPAQMAAAKGQQVILGKKKKNFWFQKGGGSVFW